MTSPAIGTLTRTASVTMTDVRDVLWRIQSDLRTLRAQHQMIDEAHEVSLAADLQQFVYRNFVDAIRFEFLRDGVVQPGSIAYALNRQWQGSESDPSGGLRCRDLRGLTFSVCMQNTSVWHELAPQAQTEFYGGLQWNWRPIGTRPVAGVWTPDRTYGSGALAASRLVLR